MNKMRFFLPGAWWFGRTVGAATIPDRDASWFDTDTPPREDGPNRPITIARDRGGRETRPGGRDVVSDDNGWRMPGAAQGSEGDVRRRDLNP